MQIRETLVKKHASRVNGLSSLLSQDIQPHYYNNRRLNQNNTSLHSNQTREESKIRHHSLEGKKIDDSVRSTDVTKIGASNHKQLHHRKIITDISRAAGSVKELRANSRDSPGQGQFSIQKSKLNLVTSMKKEGGSPAATTQKEPSFKLRTRDGLRKDRSFVTNLVQNLSRLNERDRKRLEILVDKVCSGKVDLKKVVNDNVGDEELESSHSNTPHKNSNIRNYKHNLFELTGTGGWNPKKPHIMGVGWIGWLDDAGRAMDPIRVKYELLAGKVLEGQVETIARVCAAGAEQTSTIFSADPGACFKLRITFFTERPIFEIAFYNYCGKRQRNYGLKSATVVLNGLSIFAGDLKTTNSNEPEANCTKIFTKHSQPKTLPKRSHLHQKQFHQHQNLNQTGVVGGPPNEFPTLIKHKSQDISFGSVHSTGSSGGVESC